MLKALSVSVVCFTLASLSLTTFAKDINPEKEWTFLTFLNGHNNLDSYGKLNMNQMEDVGSSDQVNVVVQWASSANAKTKRILIKKDSDKTNVTSPSVQELARVDMGDYRSLVDFVKWGIQNYPAKHYFINVWNHGSGWHRRNRTSRDISSDDFTKHKMTTVELGKAVAEIAGVLGRKVDLIGADACLMSMIEVMSELHTNANYFVGSQEVEPGEGWPYDRFLKRWIASPTATAKDVSTYLVEEYIKGAKSEDVTLSAFDLSQTQNMESAMTALGKELTQLGSVEWGAVKAATKNTISFSFPDYVDVFHLVQNLSTTSGILSTSTLEGVKSAVSQFVVANGTGALFKEAHGVSIWWPTDEYYYSKYRDAYNNLGFNQRTSWGEVVDAYFSH